MPTPFEANKTAKELGIDTTRRFIVLEDSIGNFKKGDILTLKYDDNSWAPWFYSNRYPQGESHVSKWDLLAYADEPEPSKELYEPRVGDRVSLEGEIIIVDQAGIRVVFDGSHNSLFTASEKIKHITLLSRKQPRTLTKPEAEALLKEKLGEEVLITNE